MTNPPRRDGFPGDCMVLEREAWCKRDELGVNFLESTIGLWGCAKR